MPTLRPWRELIVPRRDVIEGRVQESEFAADLHRVSVGQAPEEYQDAARFFERTYITEGMRLLLESVLRRLLGQPGGDPVIQLQTSFGGGKTHTMLAVWHVARGERQATELPGVSPLLDRVGALELPQARVAVLDGHALSPSSPRTHGDVHARTLWGELAWQLAGEAGYAMLADADRDGTSPGKERLAQLFEAAGPTVVLMDELVAYIRQFAGRNDRLVGGSFDTIASFIQALTEAASLTPRVVVLASLPESQIEIGLEAGQQALDMLQKYFGRKEAVWKPVTAEEAFEIVRRRLFEPPDELGRDAICHAFAELYRSAPDRFPTETREEEYGRRLRQSWPIHPEVFTRLYEDWATLDKFQKTRGVLRLMAQVVHALWRDNHQGPVILPGNLPLNDSRVRTELIKFLPGGWDSVVERDIDGAGANPTRIDNEAPVLGATQMTRRCARTIFLGSAPSVAAQRVRGLTIERVRLGCVEPGQSIGHVDDALRRMMDRLHYLYDADLQRFWYDLRPNLRREAEDRMGRFGTDDIDRELGRRVESLLGARRFAPFHVFAPHSDVPDDEKLRVVVFEPSQFHQRSATTSRATTTADQYLRNRGPAPRLNQNRLVFLALDGEQLAALQKTTCRYLAWKSIVADIEPLNLDQVQTADARKNLEAADTRLKGATREAWRFALVPEQKRLPAGGTGPMTWLAVTLSAHPSRSLQEAITDALTHEEHYVSAWAPFNLLKLLQEVYWKPGVPHVPVLKVWQDACRYPWIHRLASWDVFKDTLQNTLNAGKHIACAQDFDEATGRYTAITEHSPGEFTITDRTLIVDLTAIKAQRLADEAAARTRALSIDADLDTHDERSPTPHAEPERSGRPAPLTATAPPAPVVNRRFFATVELDPRTGAIQLADIQSEVIQHLMKHPRARVTVTLDIESTLIEGFDAATERTVNANCQTLGFSNFKFERS